MITDGVQPSLHVEYKSSHVKQYFKDQHVLRTETTINNPKDVYVTKGVDQLGYLRDLGQGVNRRLLEIERVSHACGLKVAFFYSKLYLRVLRPNWNALLPTSDALPRPLRQALDRLATAIRIHEEAALAA